MAADIDGYISNMQNKFTEKETQFFKRLQPNRFKLGYLFFVLLFLMIAGWLYDPIMAFQLLKKSKNIWSWLLGSMFLCTIGFVGEGIFSWLDSKEGVAHPIYLRIFHLIMLLGLCGLLCSIFWAFFKYSNLYKI